MKQIRLLRVSALVLAAVMLVCALAGCGAKNNGKLIVGKWKTNIDFEEVLAEGLKEIQDGDVLASMDCSDISLQLNAEFKSDGTYTIMVDPASGEAALQQIKERMVSALKEYIRLQFAEGSNMPPDAVTDEQLDNLLAKLGVPSWEEWSESIGAALEGDQLFSPAVLRGKYLFKDGKLYTSASVDKEPDEDSGVLCKVNSKTLTIRAEGEQLPAFMKELSFTRAN